MSNYPKIVWSEGIFIAPQHFQQQEKYLESRLDKFIINQSPFFYGVQDMELDQSFFKQGVVKFLKFSAIMKDGTLISLFGNQLDRLMLKIPHGLQSSKLYVAIQSKYNGVNEVSFSKEDVHSRYYAFDKKINDLTDLSQESRSLVVAELNVRLVLEKDLSDSLIALPVAIVSLDNNGEIHLDEQYIPPTLSSQKNPILSSYISETYGLLVQKGKSLSQGLHDPNQGSQIEILDILMLQTINRYTAYLHHENQPGSHIHPELLFIELSKICADLMTFSKMRRPDDFLCYDHDNLKECFSKLILKLRMNLSTIREQRIIRIALEQRDEATYVAQTPNNSILNIANFILAVKSDLPDEILRTKVPSTMKISTVENIRNLIAYHLPGVKLNALSVAPRELPYHSGYVYFELDKNSEMWELFNDTSGMAFHLAGDFPNVDLEFWAIKPIN